MKVGVKMRLLKVKEHLAYEASKICALSWKKAYQGIIPQNYLDDLPLNKSEASLINTVFENYHENFIKLLSRKTIFPFGCVDTQLFLFFNFFAKNPCKGSTPF